MKHSFSELTFEELVIKKEELTNKIQELRFKKATGQLNNPIEIRTLRRSIARIITRLYNLVDVVTEDPEVSHEPAKGASEPSIKRSEKVEVSK